MELKVLSFVWKKESTRFGSILCQGDPAPYVGTIPNGVDIVRNAFVTFSGVRDSTFCGKPQKSFKTVAMREPTLEENNDRIDTAHEKLLVQSGICYPTIARAIVKTFKNETTEILKSLVEGKYNQKSFQNKLGEAHRIRMTLFMEKLQQGFEAYETNGLATLHLVSNGFDFVASKRAVESLGHEGVLKAVNKNPYIMCRYIKTFREVDKACQFYYHVTFDDPRRLNAIIAHAIKTLRTNDSGSFNVAEKKEDVLNCIDATYMDNALNEAIAEHLKTREDVEDAEFRVDDTIDATDHVVYEAAYYKAECSLANCLASFVKKPIVPCAHDGDDDDDAEEPDAKRARAIQLDENQQRAIDNALSSKVSVLSGIAGSGKSATVAMMAKKMRHVVILAPTGKAVQRVHDLLRQYDVDSESMHISTIHSFLASYENATEESITLLIKPFVIVDETSMLSLELADELLQTLCIFAKHIVFVGDPEQLPSIDPGTVFRDLIECKQFPHVFLGTARRANGLLLENARAILKGDPILVDGDVVSLCDATFDSLIESATQRLDGHETPPAVICRRNVDADKMNLVMQAKYNPPAPGSKAELKTKHATFRVGDVVMNTNKNYYARNMQSWKSLDGISYDPIAHGSTIANGELGVISEIDAMQRFVRVSFRSGVLGWYDEDKLLCDLDHLKHGYAYSVHKSQGDEHDVVFALVPPSTRVCGRSLLYTACTRAKQKLVLFGNADKLHDEANDTTSTTNRRGFLQQRIIAAMQ